MKKVVLSIVCLLSAVFLIGCAGKKYTSSAIVDGLSGTIEGTVTYAPGKSLSLRIKNNSETAFSYPLTGKWEKYDGEQWVEIKLDPDMDFLVSLRLAPGESSGNTNGQHFDIANRKLEPDEKLTPGKYRVGIQITLERSGWDNSTEQERSRLVYFAFEVE